MSSQYLGPQRVERLLMSPDGVTMVPVSQHAVTPRQPFDTDEAGELAGPLADGYELFAQAVARAPRTSPGHTQLVIAIGDYHYKACACGWVSLPHVSALAADREACSLHAAELERAVRAHRSGAEVIAALRNLACAGAELIHAPNGAVSETHRHGVDEAKR